MKTLKHYITIILLVITCVSVVNASENNTNIEKMNIKEINNLMYNLTDSYIKHNTDTIDTSVFTDNIIGDIINYTNNNNIGGEIRNIVVDFTYPDNSSTGDTVIMVNTKVKYSEYDKLYLFEYHINADGKIYGFNAWVY